MHLKLNFFTVKDTLFTNVSRFSLQNNQSHVVSKNTYENIVDSSG